MLEHNMCVGETNLLANWGSTPHRLGSWSTPHVQVQVGVGGLVHMHRLSLLSPWDLLAGRSACARSGVASNKAELAQPMRVCLHTRMLLATLFWTKTTSGYFLTICHSYRVWTQLVVAKHCSCSKIVKSKHVVVTSKSNIAARLQWLRATCCSQSLLPCSDVGFAFMLQVAFQWIYQWQRACPLLARDIGRGVGKEGEGICLQMTCPDWTCLHVTSGFNPCRCAGICICLQMHNPPHLQVVDRCE